MAGARELALAHTHTREHIDLVYAVQERYVPESLGLLNHFLRDHYSGEVGAMDPQLFDLLHRVRQTLGATTAFEVISGYRGPATNEHLRLTRGGGVATPQPAHGGPCHRRAPARRVAGRPARRRAVAARRRRGLLPARTASSTSTPDACATGERAAPAGRPRHGARTRACAYSASMSDQMFSAQLSA